MAKKKITVISELEIDFKDKKETKEKLTDALDIKGVKVKGLKIIYK